MELPAGLRPDLERRSEPQHLWCSRCCRAYRNDQYRLVKGIHMCPYEDCEADTLFDSWDWNVISKATGYPEEPELGVVYRTN